MKIKINNKNYQANEGETILDVCQREGIRIPTLCSFEKLKREAICRLCLVEINGKLVTSCTTKISEGLEVITENENIKKARKINLELLWADHAGKCATCKKNLMCELQKLAEEYKIENFHFVPRKGEITNSEELDLLKDNWGRVIVENKNPCISRNSEFCIECKRCINICPEKKFGFNYRGSAVVVGTPYEKILDCSFCGECVRACPTASLTDQNDYKRIIEILDDLKKLSVAILDFGISEKIYQQLKILYNKAGKNSVLNENISNIIIEVFKSLGFEKIIELEKENFENVIIEKIKTEYAKENKINSKDIVIFLISSKISKKKNKNNFLDFVLSEREIARLVRDKEKIKEGKIFFSN